MAAKKTNLAKLKEMYDKQKSGGGKFAQSWKPKEEESIIRILPPAEEDGVFYKSTGDHSFGGHWVWCPRLENGGKCPMCEETRRRYNSGTELDVTIARKIKPRKKYMYNIIDRRGDDPTEVHMYMSGVKVFEKLLSYYFDEEYGALDDIDKGYDYKLIKKKQGDYWNYDDSRPLKTASALSEDASESAEILSGLKDLDTFVTLKSYEELKELVDGFLVEFYDEDAGETVREKVIKKKETPGVTIGKAADKLKEPPSVEEDDGGGDIDEFEKKLMLELKADEE